MTHYLVWSVEHCAWWKPGGWGYTTATHAAGRFTYEQACEILRDAHHAVVPTQEVAVVAPSRQQTTFDLAETGITVPWLEKSDEAFAPSPEVTAAPVKDAVNATEGVSDEQATVDGPGGDAGGSPAIDRVVERGVSARHLPEAGLGKSKRPA
jgi:hypothetical protein